MDGAPTTRSAVDTIGPPQPEPIGTLHADWHHLPFPTVLDLTFLPDRGAADPVYRQLGTYLRDLIAAERLPAGAKLPATRELATTLGLSRATVSLAYEELIAQGLLTAHVGQGTFVSRPSARGIQSRSRGDGDGRGFVWSGLLALRARALPMPTRLLGPRTAGRPRYDFRGGQVDVASLPAAELRRAFGGAIGVHLRAVADDRDPRGWAPLRTQIARYLVGRGIACDAADVAVVNGAQQAIDLVSRVLLDPGDTVAMEQPGYFGAALAFTAAQANVVGVRVDGDGVRVDDLARVLRARRVKLVYTTPAAHSPTGAVLSSDRRATLLALADEHQTPILEDDYDSELRYEGAPVAALKTLDRAGQVIYAGTFSKMLFPGLRVGYVVAAPELLEKMVLARWNSDVGTCTVSQAALATMLEGGGLDRHLRRVRKVYAERLAATLAALDETMPASAVWTRPRGGHSVWLTLPPGVDPAALAQSAGDAGLSYTPGEAFHVDGRGAENIHLSFAALPPADIRAGIALLADLVRAHGGERRRRSAR
jgi:GntR family transcriptional regulator/MocR family aminotransferase